MTRDALRSLVARTVVLTLALVSGPALAPWSTANADNADNPVPRTYLGNSFGDSLPGLPTSFEQQSKMWFHDEAWWALMLEPADSSARIFELRPDHSWRSTGTVINSSPTDIGDALLDGEVLYVVSRGAADTLQFRRLTYDEQIRNFTPDAVDPVVITDRGSQNPATITKDTTGRLWITFATTSAVFLAYSDDEGGTWIRPFIIPASASLAAASHSEISALVAFGGKIGVMWSDQTAGAFYFAVHRDGDPADRWSVETALDGPGLADDHISLKAAGSGPSATVVAAVKTSQGDAGEAIGNPLIVALSRAPNGIWTNTPAGTVGEGVNSPLIQVDETNNLLYLLVQAPGGVVYARRSSLPDISFSSGLGTPFVFGGPSRPADATGSKHPVTHRTGLVVLTSGTSDRRYNHAELEIVPPEHLAEEVASEDSEPPTAPGRLLATVGGSGAVTISWSASTDGDRWFPAADSVPVRDYTVFRDGLEVGTTTRTSFGDVPPASGRSYEYSILATDRAGNESAPSTVRVAFPGDEASNGLPGWSLLALAIAAAATAAAVLLTLRRRAGRR